MTCIALSSYLYNSLGAAGLEWHQQGGTSLRRVSWPLPVTVSQPRTGHLPLEKLEALADALLDFQGPADLASWLAANA
jgi:hypothetical protein